MKKTAKVLSVILIVMFMITVSGCKDKNIGDKGETSVEEANKTLKLHCYSYTSLNPLVCNDDTNLQVLRLMFESLFECDETQKAKPVLADMYSVSKDGLNWTVKLKDNVLWHDKSKLTADDVKKSYDDVISLAEKSPYFGSLSNIEDISSDGNLTVNFKLYAPQVNFINLLEVPIVKYHGDEKFLPVGTGPYVYEKADNNTVFLTAFSDYYGDKAQIENIEIKILPDSETAVYAYVSKEIDMVNIVSSDDLGKYSSNSDNNIIDYPSNVFNYICINKNTEPLSNRLFRSAVAYAIDKEKICSEVLLSHGSVANTCMNTDWWVYNRETVNYGFNKERACDIMEALTDNLKISPVSLMVNNENEDKCRAAEIIKQNLADCGILINIDYVDFATFSERVNTGNYQMYFGTIKYGSDINPKYILSNPTSGLKKLFDELELQTSDEKIKEIYFNIQDKIAYDLEIIPLYFDISTVMYTKRLEGKYTPVRANIFNGIEKLKLEK